MIPWLGAVRLLIAISLFSLFEGHAANLSWSGGGGADANWSNTANWGFGPTPTNGDTLIFSGSQPNLLNTNNIAGLVLNQIRFVGTGGGYDIRGNSFTLTNNFEGTNSGGGNTIENNITLSNLDQIIHLTSSLTLSGVLSGPVGLNKTGAGTLTLAGGSPNTFAGSAVVSAGTLQLGKVGPPGGSFAIPNALILSNGTTVRLFQSWQLYQPVNSFALTTTLYPNSLLDLNGNNEWLSQITMVGGEITSGSGILFLSGNITVVSNNVALSSILGNLQLYSYLTCTNNTITNTGAAFNPDLYIYANISSSSTNSLIKSGVGQVDLAGVNNTYLGETIINAGSLSIDFTNGLGNTNLPATVKFGASLFLNNLSGMGAKPLVLNGFGYAFAPLAGFGTNSWDGNITLASDSSVRAHFPTSLLKLNGAIGGPGALLKNGDGTVTFGGVAPNTYAGLTTVSSGALELNKSSFNGGIPGNLDVFAVLRLKQGNQISDAADINLEVSGLLDVGTFADSLGTIHGAGGLNFGVGGFISVGSGNGSSTYDGVMSGTGYAPGYTIDKVGTGTFTMNGNNTFTAGYIEVDNGKLVINGSQPQIPVYEAGSTATLGGTGTVSTITALGIISPGNSPGILTSGDFTLSSSAKFIAELTGPNPGAGGYDQLNVIGTNKLANATLTVVPAFTTAVLPGQTFTIINNDASEPINGTFNGLAEGALITTNGFGFKISYVGGTGNDVVLTLTNIPLAGAGYSVGLGNGSGTIDPNECNYLYITITNKQGATETNITATLSTLTPNVAVTQPYSTYPNAPGNGTSTNAVPFQLSTFSNFVCGTSINLLLAVTTGNHGTVGVPITLSSGGPAVVPSRYDNNIITNIPDIGTIESTNVVSGFVGPLVKVAVLLYLTHPIDSDLTISLISPDGTNVTLASGVGGGANFGTSCSPDSSRTTFDDSAATSITNGSPPFVGTVRPQGALANFNNTTANGNWRLRITDGFGGSIGALRCWSLLLYPQTCTAGGGLCELCPNVTVYGATAANSTMQMNYPVINTAPSTCGALKPCPGTFVNGPVPADIYTFRNGPSDACITVTVVNDSPVGALLAQVYTNSFDLANTNRCVNYLADAGALVYSLNPTQSFSFNVSSNAVFILDLVTDFEVYLPYHFTVSGGDCRPALHISPTGPNQVLLDWTTAAASYRLESTNQLATGATNWLPVTNIPVVVNSRFLVTNNAAVSNQFYRLHKP